MKNYVNIIDIDPFIIMFMIRFMVLCLFTWTSLAASLLEPYQLVIDWKACREQDTLSVDCKKTQQLMMTLQANVELLQDNPQQMGMKIMSVQNEIVQAQAKPHADLQAIELLQQELAGLLATVGWLESPQ